MYLTASPTYRRDLDGLRAIAVVAVIIFHLGWLPYGYLGVDVFFVISGYLITGIIIKEVGEGRFTLWHFYQRRIRRILPLVTFITALSLVIGCLVMLPDDLENLAQSVVATNLFANNILLAITTGNYWDVVNEFKPLMHTWSLGVEEQYYIFYPMIFLIFGARRLEWSRTAIAALALVSLVLFLRELAEHRRFYFLQYRFYELAAGGLLAVLLKSQVAPIAGYGIWIVLLLVLLVMELPALSADARLLLTLASTLGILASDNFRDSVAAALLTNRLAVFMGLISFSLYMWHQPLFAYARYFVVPVITPLVALALTTLTVILAVLTYRYIEQPFRDKKRTSTYTVLGVVGLVTLITTVGGLFLHVRGGVVRDVPELEITVAESQRGLHAQYNHRIHARNQPFPTDHRLRVLVVGNSFARDWANVLLESRHGKSIDLSYAPELTEDALQRAAEADVIYISTADYDTVAAAGLAMDRVWSVGTKSFGESSGYFYNRRHMPGYCGQRAVPEPHVVEANAWLAESFGARYIDLMALVADANGTMPVFTPQCLFISQDTRHLTRAGAAFFAELLDDQLAMQLKSGKWG